LARRNWEKIFDAEYVRKLIAKKQTNSYKSYQWVKTQEQKEYYVDRGFVASDGVATEEDVYEEEVYAPIAMEQISDDWKESLQDIVTLCDKEGIKLTLFIAPIPEKTLIAKGNYSDYSNMVRELAYNLGVKYYDFNLCKEKYFLLQDFEHFKDYHHLNTKGAELFSNLFCEFFSGKISEVELFYSSFEEKVMN